MNNPRGAIKNLALQLKLLEDQLPRNQSSIIDAVAPIRFDLISNHNKFVTSSINKKEFLSRLDLIAHRINLLEEAILHLKLHDKYLKTRLVMMAEHIVDYVELLITEVRR